VAGRGYQNVITTDLVDDPILTEDNIRYFKKISKELYNFTVVRHDYSSASIRISEELTKTSIFRENLTS
jgi:hypothetical protein